MADWFLHYWKREAQSQVSGNQWRSFQGCLLPSSYAMLQCQHSSSLPPLMRQSSTIIQSSAASNQRAGCKDCQLWHQPIEEEGTEEAGDRLEVGGRCRLFISHYWVSSPTTAPPQDISSQKEGGRGCHSYWQEAPPMDIKPQQHDRSASSTAY
jgi:hypothetical protein